MLSTEIFAVLTFQESRDGVRGKGLAHVLNDILHHAVKKVLLVDAVALHNIPGDYGMINAVDNLIGTLLVILTKRNELENRQSECIPPAVPGGTRRCLP